MPQPLKPEDRRQRRNVRPALNVVKGALASIPAAPAGLLPAIREVWARYWSAPISRVAEVSDQPGVMRLFRLYDERERAYRGLRKYGRIVRGSQGQDVLNPLAKYISDCDAKIVALEDRLGLNPKSRLQLGITFGEAQKTLADLNRDLDVGDGDDPREEVAVAEA